MLRVIVESSSLKVYQWTQFCAMCSMVTLLGQGGWTDDLLWFFPTQLMLCIFQAMMGLLYS